MLYYLTVALQGFCIYHAYKNSKNYYWYFIIIFLPLLGCGIYLFTQVFNKKDVSVITEEITNIVNPTKKIKELQQELAFSNTFQNKINLADAFAENVDFENAILYYQKALEGNFRDDPHTINKLVKCYFEIKDYQKVIENSEKINLDKEFKDSIYFFGLALEKEGFINKAEKELRKIDLRYSNYFERLEFANFYLRNNERDKAKQLLTEIKNELKS
ncbi:hypothetical protein, partial [Polaribacter sp.]|uniref:hypothetical protein n=1 Tax=Polaribacter sp. TaxID=1920175 RepID=UPI003F6AB238